MIGTTVEFYDFHIYATAASLVFGPLFFPASMGSAGLTGAYASFGLAFLRRPLGGAVFGHFGDRVGRKATLVASLVLMGVSTAAIGLLPSYAVAGWPAPVLLCLFRFGQGFALGGELMGAALLALENAPPGWRARFAMTAPLGAPAGTAPHPGGPCRGPHLRRGGLLLAVLHGNRLRTGLRNLRARLRYPTHRRRPGARRPLQQGTCHQ